jgi:hypothetical protein
VKRVVANTAATRKLFLSKSLWVSARGGSVLGSK